MGIETTTEGKKDGKKKKSKHRKQITVSYSCNGGYDEKKLICDIVSSLRKDYNLQNDIWIDKDEECLMSSSWMSLRMEAIERCKAAILITSKAFWTDKITVGELKTLLERNKQKADSVKIYVIIYDSNSLPPPILSSVTSVVDLSDYHQMSTVERSFVVVGSIGHEIEKYFSSGKNKVKPQLSNATTEEFKDKFLLNWSVFDVQSWLLSIGLSEFHSNIFLEREIDGFLLAALSEEDLTSSLLIEHKIIVRKIPEAVRTIISNAKRKETNWHYKFKSQKPKPNHVYLIYDPADVQTVYLLKSELTERGFKVETHSNNLGQSREEFLIENGPIFGSCSNFLVILSENAGTSPYVYNECIFIDWMERLISVALLPNGHIKIRPGLKALLSDKSTVDFDPSDLKQSVDIIEYLIKPATRTNNNVVFEKTFLNSLSEKIGQLKIMLAKYEENSAEDDKIRVYLSYQWSTQIEVHRLAKYLEQFNIVSWADFSTAAIPQKSSKNSSETSVPSIAATLLDTLDNVIIEEMKRSTAVLCCISEEYSNSMNCHKDLYSSTTLRKPIIPVLLTNTKFPPDSPQEIKHFMVQCQDRLIDLSSPMLFKSNLPKLAAEILKIAKAQAKYKSDAH